MYENAVDAQNLTIDLSKDVVKVAEMKKVDPVRESGKGTFVTTVCTNEDSAYIRVNLNSQKAMMFVADPSRQNAWKELPALFDTCKAYQESFPDFDIKMHLMPGGASTLLHDDGDGKNKPYGRFIHNINKGKKFEFKMADARGADTHSVKCKNNREHIIVYGTADSFCDSTIAKHRGSYEGEEIGCTVVMDPKSKIKLLYYIFCYWHRLQVLDNFMWLL